MNRAKKTSARSGLGRWLMPAAALIVASVAVLVFRHTLGHEFVTWDDDVYVYENPAFTAISAPRIAALLWSFYYFAYIPVTLLSHAIDVLIWGLNPRGHHLTNVLLHAANAAWVLGLGVLFSRLSAARRASAGRPRDPSAAVVGMGIAAILFAVHPLRAESVAWISDRKDLLCAFFALPALAAYLLASERSGTSGRGRWLALSFALFLLAVLSKSTAVAFPIVLLVLDWYRGRRGGSLLIEKIPFFAVAGAVTALSLALTPHKAPAYAVAHLSGPETVLFPFYALSFPLYKTLAPVSLGPIYPRVGFAWMVAGLAVFVVVTGIVAVLAKRGTKGPLVAWLAYLCFLVPNIVGLSSGAQPVADRYSYLATIPLGVLVGMGIAAWWERGDRRRRVSTVIAAVALVAVLVAATVPQASRWRTSTSLWEYVVTEFPARRDYTDAYVNLGAAYAQAGRRAEAGAILDKAVAMDPANPKALYNLGVISYFQGNRPKALDCFRRASQADPHPGTAYFNRALVCEELGLHDEALDSMMRAARTGSKEAQEALTSRGLRW